MKRNDATLPSGLTRSLPGVPDFVYEWHGWRGA